MVEIKRHWVYSLRKQNSRASQPREGGTPLVLSLASGPQASKVSITVLFQEVLRAVILKLD